MDRALNAFVNLDVPADVVRVDINGTLNQSSRPELVHIVRRVRRMGIRSHIRVDLSGAGKVESSALAGLRSDLNAIDSDTLPGIYGNGVSLAFSPSADGWAARPDPAQPPLALIDVLTDLTEDGEDFADGYPLVPTGRLEELCGRPLEEYSDAELLTASDWIFGLLDTPSTFAGPDLLGRYNDIGLEFRRRRQQAAPLPASEDQAAS